jgi:hypothetical protein
MRKTQHFRPASTTITQTANKTLTYPLPPGSTAVRLYVWGTPEVYIGFGASSDGAVTDLPVGTGAEVFRTRVPNLFLTVYTPTGAAVSITFGDL